MSDRKVDVIFHPTRMRILVNLASQSLTAQQLARTLPDIPQASLYRHLNALGQHGMLKVVSERPVRGTVEKVYALDDQAARLTVDDLQHISKDDHMRYFTMFVMSLLSDFTRYIEQHDSAAIGKDGLRYNKGMLYLTDDELHQLQTSFRDLLLPLLANTPDEQRQGYIFGTVLIPSVDHTSPAND